MNLESLYFVLQSQVNDANLSQGIGEILQQSLQAVDPYRCIEKALHKEDNDLYVDNHRFSLESYDRVVLLSIGKAANLMGKAVYDILGERLADGIIVSKTAISSGDVFPVFFTQLIGGHPIPNQGSVDAGKAVLKLLEDLTVNDLVIFCISGGGSALITHPAEEINLGDLQTLTRLMLENGCSIDEINTIRKHLDLVKGGGLAKAAYPAAMVTLILSDVVGNPLGMIASGPTVPDETRFEDALTILEKYHLLKQTPNAIVTYLRRSAAGEIPETPKPDDPIFENSISLIVGSNVTAAEAGARKAIELGFYSKVLSSQLQGDAREVGSDLGKTLRSFVENDATIGKPFCLIAGGETTITLTGTGSGGRNLEVALAAAKEIDGLDHVVFISLATDGEDGPTDAAGAVVTGRTMKTARKKNIPIQKILLENDTYHFFEPIDALIKIGSTGTNVNDLYFLIAG
jgi:hydroxypyruvate reductase